MFKTAIYGEKQWAVEQAFENLALDEYWAGLTDERLWAKVLGMTTQGKWKLPPAVSGDLVLNLAILEQSVHKAVLDQYCRLRGAESLAQFKSRNAEIENEIKRVYAVAKLYAKPWWSAEHLSLDIFSYTTRHTSKYVLALLIVCFAAILVDRILI